MIDEDNKQIPPEFAEWARTIAGVRSFDEAVSVGVDLLLTASDSNFYIGDLALRLSELDPDDDDGEEKKSRTLADFAREMRLDYSRVKEAVRVARAVEMGVRASFRGVLYSHFRSMVRFGVVGSDLVAWAKRVQDENMTVAQLEAALVQELRGGGGASGSTATLFQKMLKAASAADREEADAWLSEHTLEEARDALHSVYSVGEWIQSHIEKQEGEDGARAIEEEGDEAPL